MGKRPNSNIRHTVTDGPFTVQICQRCMFDPKKKNSKLELAYRPQQNSIQIILNALETFIIIHNFIWQHF